MRPTGSAANSDASPESARLKKLAASIEALTEKDELAEKHAREIETMRDAAADELYAICAEFVNGLNRLLQRPEVMIDPGAADAGHLRGRSHSLIQINVR